MLLEKRIFFVGGKGGVGKSSISASLGAGFSKNYKTLLISTDPAHNLGDIFDVKLSNKPKEVQKNLFIKELDPQDITDKHFKEIEDKIKIYAGAEMFSRVQKYLTVAKNSPGANEAAMLEAICLELINYQDYDKIIFDTAPTGHTMRLFSLPMLMDDWTDELLKSQEKNLRLQSAKSVFYEKGSFATKSRWDLALESIKKRKELFRNSTAILKDTKICAIFFVLNAQKLSRKETTRAIEDLSKLGLSCSGLFVNKLISTQSDEFWQRVKQDQDLELEKIQKLKLPTTKIALRKTPPLSVADLESIFTELNQ